MGLRNYRQNARFGLSLSNEKPYLIANARLVDPGADEEAAGAEEVSWLLEVDLGRAFLMFTGLDTGDTSGVDVPKDRRISFISFLVQSVLSKPPIAIGKIDPSNFPFGTTFHYFFHFTI